MTTTTVKSPGRIIFMVRGMNRGNRAIDCFRIKRVEVEESAVWYYYEVDREEHTVRAEDVFDTFDLARQSLLEQAKKEYDIEVARLNALKQPVEDVGE